MPTYVKNLNNAVLVFQPLADDAYHDVDLSPFGISADAKGVVIRAFSTANGQSVNMRDALDTTGGDSRVSLNMYSGAAISLNGGSTITLRRETGSVVFAIEGEFQDDCVLYSTAKQIPIIEAQFGTWIDRQPVPQGTDVLAGIKAVIVSYPWQSSADAVGTVGIREKGSIFGPWDSHRTADAQWTIVGVDSDGYYQVYTTGEPGTDNEHTRFMEIGYILNSSNIVTVKDPTNEDLSGTAGATVELDLSGTLSKHAITAGLCWKNTSGLPAPPGHLKGYARAVGSSESMVYSEVGRLRSMTHAVTLDADLKAEYIMEQNDEDHETYVLWYEVGMPSTVVAKTFAGPATGADGFSGPATGAAAQMTQSCGGIAHMGSG